MNLHRQALGDSGFADARITDVDRIVLPPSTEHMNGPLDLIIAADERIDEALRRFVDQVHGKRFQRLHPSATGRSSPLFFLVGLRLGFFLGGDLRHAVGDIIDQIETSDALLFQQEKPRRNLARDTSRSVN